MINKCSINRYFFSASTIFLLIKSLTACGLTQTAQQQQKIICENKNTLCLLQTSKNKFITKKKSRAIEEKILIQYADWKGVNYRFGGKSKKGVDCSAFVQLTFREQFGLNLPRTTAEQQKVGKKIERGNLMPGDLILFRSGRNGRHIGIYLSNNKFVHASSSKGVSISMLDGTYWNKRYYVARRVI